jgi:hypothetical protein
LTIELEQVRQVRQVWKVWFLTTEYTEAVGLILKDPERDFGIFSEGAERPFSVFGGKFVRVEKVPRAKFTNERAPNSLMKMRQVH